MKTVNLPSLETLHERHIGLTIHVAGAYAEAARLCLGRHHRTPIRIHIHHGSARVKMRVLSWKPPTKRILRAFQNADDATRDGAYSVALAVVETELNLFAIERSETRTGADYYLGNPEKADLERALRLEVSGTDRGDEQEINRRLKQKLQQAKDGVSDTPAVACVVGFQARIVAMEKCGEKHA